MFAFTTKIVTDHYFTYIGLDYSGEADTITGAATGTDTTIDPGIGTNLTGPGVDSDVDS